MARAIAKSAGAPIVMTAHTDFAYFIFGRFRGDPILKKLFAIWGKHAYRLAKAVIVPSEKAAALPQLASTANRLTVIPSGIQLERYQRPVSSEQRAALFRRYGLADNGCTLVMVTRVSREKNIAEIFAISPRCCGQCPRRRSSSWAKARSAGRRVCIGFHLRNTGADLS